MHRLYLLWARNVVHLDQLLNWSRGRMGNLIDRTFPSPER